MQTNVRWYLRCSTPDEGADRRRRPTYVVARKGERRSGDAAAVREL